MNDLLENMLAIYHSDPLVQSYLNSLEITLEKLINALEDVENQLWLDKLTWSVDDHEKELGIKSNPSKSIEDRRYGIMAKWRASGKSDIYLLQTVANSWKNGEVNVDFVGGKIKLTFNSTYGVPLDMPGLIAAMDEVKPAHLALTILYNYLLIRDVEAMIISELETMTLDKFAF